MISTREGLLTLLGEGVRNAGAFGRVRKQYDDQGICHTPCSVDDPVGTCTVLDPEAEEGVRRVPTKCFTICTLQVSFEDGTRGHVILSAYPVHPDRF